MRRLYLVTRDLHLYFGLFLSPFILVFSVSVFYLVHGSAYRRAPDASDNARTFTNVAVPPDIARLQGRARSMRFGPCSTSSESAARLISFATLPQSVVSSFPCDCLITTRSSAWTMTRGSRR